MLVAFVSLFQWWQDVLGPQKPVQGLLGTCKELGIKGSGRFRGGKNLNKGSLGFGFPLPWFPWKTGRKFHSGGLSWEAPKKPRVRGFWKETGGTGRKKGPNPPFVLLVLGPFFPDGFPSFLFPKLGFGPRGLVPFPGVPPKKGFQGGLPWNFEGPGGNYGNFWGQEVSPGGLWEKNFLHKGFPSHFGIPPFSFGFSLGKIGSQEKTGFFGGVFLGEPPKGFPKFKGEFF